MIFKEMTGKPIPEKMKLNITQIEKNNEDYVTLGKHRFKSQDINIADFGYEMSLATLMHELGHGMHQGQEESYKNSVIYFTLKII